MQLTPLTKFIAALSAQILLILIIIIFKFAVYAGGTEVLLRIQPIDPTDPLRGDYVTFQYDISRIHRSYFDHQPVQGTTVYVPLYTSGLFATPVNGQITRSIPRDSKYVYLKGVVTSVRSNAEAGARDVTIDYGIEEYFIPEGVGRTLDFTNRTVSAKVAIDPNGEAVLKQLYMDGQEWP